LHSAASNGIEVVAWLVEHGADVNAAAKDGWTVLHSAASNGIEVVAWLVEHGADVKAADKDGQTVLHWAASNGKLEVVAWLVERGADVTAKGSWGTALDVAAKWGHTDVVKLLERAPDKESTITGNANNDR